ncbi:hypothetical protein OBV_05140 [Oscillibacter valericigenes Sjm18-20]|nr:hypothetical protein OBV_05140 [Oscillibacter valericigenes Sjm18-20]
MNHSFSKEYLNFVLEQCSNLDDLACRAMMGEYILYLRGKIIGGIYDDRLLVEPVDSAKKRMPDSVHELPYSGTKGMLLVDNVDSKELLSGLFKAMVEEPPQPKGRRNQRGLIDW